MKEYTIKIIELYKLKAPDSANLDAVAELLKDNQYLGDAFSRDVIIVGECREARFFENGSSDNRIADLHREIQKRDRRITELEPDCEHIMNMHQANQYFEKLQIVQGKLDKRALLEGLAEEAAELAQAALKLIRTMGSSKNVTPTSEEEAWEHLYEEIADVENCTNALEICDEDFLDIQQEKMIRWADRLTASQGADE